METHCEESLHESQRQMEPSDSVEAIEYRLRALRNDVEHDQKVDESEVFSQSRKKRKKKRSKERIAIMA